MAKEKNTIFTSNELEAKEKIELDKIKTINDILNNQEVKHSWWRRMFPYIMPLTGLLLTIFLNFKGCYDKNNIDDKAKFREAESRYNGELDLVKLVWDDLKKPQDTLNYNRAIKYVSLLNSQLNNFRKDDSAILGIGNNNRPLSMLFATDTKVASDVVDLKINSIGNTITTDFQSTDIVKLPSILNNKKNKEIINTVNDIAKNNLKVYIQFANKEDTIKPQEIADKLKQNYIVPPIDYVKNTSGYQNEIRFYNNNDKNKAIELKKQLMNITGQDYALRNINSTAATNTIEVWIDNTPKDPKFIALKQLPEKPIDNKSEYELVLNNTLFAAVRYFNNVTDDISINIDNYNEEKNEVTMHINDSASFTIEVGKSKEMKLGDYKILIELLSYERRSSLKRNKVALYNIQLFKKKN